MGNLKVDLARKFSDSGAFKYDPACGFKLSSGIRSQYYVDCKELMGMPCPRNLVAQLAFDALKDLSFDCIGGLEIGAISIATSISDYAYNARPSREWRTFVVRKHAKDHGLGKVIEGKTQKGEHALIVDDVLTSGGSIIKAVRAARDFGLKVEHALVIVDREEQEGRHNIEAEGVQLLSLLTISELMKLGNFELVGS